jgi:serine protease Do
MAGASVALAELEGAIRRVAEHVGSSVVGVSGGRAVGSGVVVADGTVLTNAHNLSGEEVAVTFADGRRTTGTVKALDADGDLAVVDVDTEGAPAVAWSDGPAERGAVVFALANPGGRGLRTTFGVLSGTDEAFRGPRGRRITGSLEHTAPLPRGSSGGPVVDADGRLLGINTHRLGDGFYLALPADQALRDRVAALGRGESRTRPLLGVALAPPRAARQLRRAVGLPERDGLLVRGVVEGGPAAAAGLREGDLLVAANGAALTSTDDLHAVLDAAAPGSTITLSIVRGLDELDVEVAV